MNPAQEQFNRFLNFLTADASINDSGTEGSAIESFYITQEDDFLITLEDNSGYLLREIAP